MGRQYIPALGHDWLTRFYDPLLGWTMRESVFKCRLVEQAGICPGQRVLDLGCGTATLTLLIRQAHPQACVVGVDGDAKALLIAQGKAVRDSTDLILHRAMAYQLPYADGCFDRVVSSLLFHHLTREEKQRTLREVWRVLRSAGELHIADWGKAEDWRMRTAFFLVQLLDGFNRTADNVHGALPELLSQVGFDGVRESDRLRTIFGALSLYQAQKPPAEL
ncbi:MAG: class I SAM-dependent methyltransferase [Acidobacteria bacterium]|nr:class I SAM-dependent methyltransferase [Acidobacteriota bacterium]